MNKKIEATREDARRILKKGILDMSIGRLIQMSHYGLMGNIILSNESSIVDNSFNRIEYDEEDEMIFFLAKEPSMDDMFYGSISFTVDSITEISGCEDEENPDEYLNVNIKLKDDTMICIRILY